LSTNKYKIALITGRAFPWVQDQFIKIKKWPIKIPIYLEHSLVSFVNDQLSISEIGKKFIENYETQIIDRVDLLLKEKFFRFIKTKLTNPEPGLDYIWEDKLAMISIVTTNENPNPTPIQRIVDEVIQQLQLQNEIKIGYHHLGVDILPRDTSKRTAANHAQGILDPKNAINKWICFGDNISDKEMTLAKPKISEFVYTENASQDVLDYLYQNNYTD